MFGLLSQRNGFFQSNLPFFLNSNWLETAAFFEVPTFVIFNWEKSWPIPLNVSAFSSTGIAEPVSEAPESCDGTSTKLKNIPSWNLQHRKKKQFFQFSYFGLATLRLRVFSGITATVFRRSVIFAACIWAWMIRFCYFTQKIMQWKNEWTVLQSIGCLNWSSAKTLMSNVFKNFSASTIFGFSSAGTKISR